MAKATCSIEDCEEPVYRIKHGWCSKHYDSWRKHGDPAFAKPRLRKTPRSDGLKECTKCKQVLPPAEFHRRELSWDGLQPHCRTCASQRRQDPSRYREVRQRWQREHRDLHRGYERKYHLKKNYGITAEQYDALYEAQSGHCAICGKICPVWPERGRLVVDHDHATGRIRGLLCNGCNVGLALLGDTTEGLSRAVSYLQE